MFHLISYFINLDISNLLKKTSTKHELLNLLADISHLCQEIGLLLNVSDNVLNGLKHNQESNTTKLSEIIKCWLSTTQRHLVTRETVIDSIEGPIVKHMKKANEIHQYLTKAS